MDVSGADFSSQLMYFRNPSINTFDAQEFTSPSTAEYSPIQHEMSIQSYEKPSLRKRNIAGFKYDELNSSSRSAIYVHHGKTPAEKRIVHANRGTVPSELRDLGTDVVLTIGEKPFRATRHFQEGQKTLHALAAQYPGHSIHQTGHSLGAKMASSNFDANPHLVDTVTTYNMPGSIPGLVADQSKRIYKTKRQRDHDRRSAHYQSKWDPVSIFRSNQNTKSAKNRSLNPHDLGRWAKKHPY
jgi:hypothetical protein